MRLPRLSVYDVGTKHRKGTIGRPTLKHGIAHLYIMIAEIASIIAHEVEHICCQMHRRGVYEVVIISGGLSLQDVTIIYQYDIVVIERTLLLHVGMYARHAAPHGIACDKVVGEKATMHIGSLDELYLHCAVLCLQQCGEDKKGNECQK